MTEPTPAPDPAVEPLPTQTDNRPRPEDGEQDVSQDPAVDLTAAQVPQ